MGTLTLHQFFWGAFVVLSVLLLFVQLIRLVSLRRSDISVARFLIAGPFLFTSPDSYFRAGAASAPWRMMLYWVLWVAGVLALAKLLSI
jgi:hypothetical protein